MTQQGIEDVLQFWFGDESSDDRVAATQSNLWWGHATETDDEIRRRFGSLVESAADGELDQWAETARGRLALIILLDQFPRNVYRGTARAYATDARARELSVRGMEKGDDKQLRPIERVFLYIPLEHSEELDDQNRCVKLYKDLAADAPPACQKVFTDYIGFGESHRDVIARFGRFPHRNEVLGRECTEEELAYLAEENPGW